MIVDGIDLDHFHGRDLARGGEQLHGQVRLAKGQAAGPGGAHAGGFERVNGVHVQRNMNPTWSAEQGDRLADRGGHAHLVDLAHGEHADAQVGDDPSFARVQRARAEQHQPFGSNPALVPAQP